MPIWPLHVLDVSVEELIDRKTLPAGITYGRVLGFDHGRSLDHVAGPQQARS